MVFSRYCITVKFNEDQYTEYFDSKSEANLFLEKKSKEGYSKTHDHAPKTITDKPENVRYHDITIEKYS